MPILRRVPRMLAFLVCRLISLPEFKRSITMQEKQVVFLRKGGMAFIDRDLERAYFGF